APDRRRRELARPPAPELGGVVGERAHVDRVEPCPAPLEPAGELLHVHAVGAAGRLGQGGTVEETLDVSVHGEDFAAARAIPVVQATAATISSLRLAKPRRNSARSALNRSTRTRYSSARPCSSYRRRGWSTYGSSIPGTVVATR